MGWMGRLYLGAGSARIVIRGGGRSFSKSMTNSGRSMAVTCVAVCGGGTGSCSFTVVLERGGKA